MSGGAFAYGAALAAWATAHLTWQAAAAAAAYNLWRAGALRAAAARHRVAVALLAALPALGVADAWAAHHALVADARALAPTALVVTEPASSLAVLDGLLDALPWLGAVWGVGVGLAGARLLVGWLRLAVLRRAGRPAPPALARRVRRLARVAGLRRLPAVRVIAPNVGPLVAGARPGLVLVPAPLLTGGLPRGLSDDEFDALLLHEFAHVRRHDYVIAWAIRGLQALLWFHPGVHALARAAAAAREECCDAEAVRATRRPVVLARALLRVHELQQGHSARLPMSAVAARGGTASDFGARVRRLVGAGVERPGVERAGVERAGVERARRPVVTRALWGGLAGAAGAAAALGPLAAARTAPVGDRLAVAGAAAGALPATRLLVRAADGRGRFTVGFRNGRVSDATADGVPLPRRALRRRGRRLELRTADGRLVVAVLLRTAGGFSWEARQ